MTPLKSAYWLFKSEPEAFSFGDLMTLPGGATGWDGVRNFQARNFLRDDVKVGDGVLFYHSNAVPPGIAGVAVVTRAGHSDPTAFDPSELHYDPKSKLEQPTWYQVTIQGIQAVEPLLALPRLREEAGLEGMELLRKGSRLSVQPVSPAHWRLILKLAGIKVDPTRRRS